MIRVGVLLAAGASRRFGPEDKLLAPLRGRPLVSYAAQAIRNTSLDRRIAVISNSALRPYLNGFEIIEINPSEQSASLRAGVVAAGECDRILIALGDMPGITSTLLERVLEAAIDERPSASRDSGPTMPPACFPTQWIPHLLKLTGDKGAGSLLRDLPSEAQILSPGQLQDIDTSHQLRMLQASEDGNEKDQNFR